MVINFSNPEFLNKVEQVQEFSNYLICPLKKSYKSFHMSLTLVFRAIHQFLTPSNSRDTSKEAIVESLKSIRDRVIFPIGDNIFSVTVDHLLPHQERPDRHHTHLTVHDTDPLRHYRPHEPSDPQSRARLLEWLKYPGILKIVQLARKLQLEYETLPSESSSQKIRNILSILTRNSAGWYFPREPTNFVRRKFSKSQEILKNMR